MIGGKGQAIAREPASSELLHVVETVVIEFTDAELGRSVALTTLRGPELQVAVNEGCPRPAASLLKVPLVVTVYGQVAPDSSLLTTRCRANGLEQRPTHSTYTRWPHIAADRPAVAANTSMLAGSDRRRSTIGRRPCGSGRARSARDPSRPTTRSFRRDHHLRRRRGRTPRNPKDHRSPRVGTRGRHRADVVQSARGHRRCTCV
jgi:hypothetical protein